MVDTLQFVYDGECPICQVAARYYRVREAVGALQLIDARDPAYAALTRDLAARGYDLDRGMVIIYQGRYYYGAEAVHLMGLLSTGSGWFNRFVAWALRSPRRARALYPFFLRVRRVSLCIKRIPPIRTGA